ncbi:ABC transporter family substrate-binding protein [Jongsikchunia kroppenstedtii]|uniref:ABC transporter family substrate-binding protein n=1 Tax=Jongsikchunia kroppenstedtii TaxID=1121721 RepID=UPI003F85354A
MRSRMSAATKLLVAVPVTASAVMLAACSASPPPPQQQSKVPDTAAEAGKDTIYVGIDSIGPGLNPHLSADQSSATSAVAALTLPSAFRPVLGADGQTVWRMDSSLLISADSTGGPAVDPSAPDAGPFTVTYKIQQNAQWSDGQPITADDFRYLWQQMVQRAGVVAPAGYRLIKDMRSTNGGKQVAVVFSAPYPDWRQLFSGLLPSHTFGGASNGFTSGLDGGLPESGGPYKISNIDRSRDEISLQRNDRYWMTPAITNSIVLRRANSTQLIDSMRNGDTRVAAVSSGRALQAQLTAITGVHIGSVAEPRVMGVTANTRSPEMADIHFRGAVLGLLDPQLLTFAGASDTATLPAENDVLAPSDPGYFPVPRPKWDRPQIDSELAAAGLTRSATPVPVSSSSEESTTTTTTTTTPPVPSGPSDAPETTTTSSSASETDLPALPAGVFEVTRGSSPVVVRVGVNGSDTNAVSVARSVVDQLMGQGIRAEVVALSASDLYGTALTDPRVDLVVGWTGVGVAPATRLASSTECLSAATPSSSSTPTPTSAPTTTTDSGSSSTQYSSNVSGLCDRQLSDIAAQAVSAPNSTDALREAEGLIAAQQVYRPVYQDLVTTAAGPGVSGVALTGPVQDGIFAGTPGWQRVGD